MTKFPRYAALLGVLLLAVTGATAFAGRDGDSDFRARLDGWEEVPSQVTAGRGQFRAKVRGNTIDYVLRYANLEGDAAQAHIHIGSRHENGGISAFLCGGGEKPPCPPRAGTIRGVIDPSDVTGPENQGVEPGNMADLLRAMRRGETYANVHTPGRAPGGEIRGQIFDSDEDDDRDH